MIVRTAGDTLHLITQPDHAALAGRVMRHWQALQNAARYASILLAVDEHDNGWREPDEAPTVDVVSGRVHDFIHAPAVVRQSVWPRAIARLGHDPWAAALVAQHALTVYDRYESDPAWRDFFAQIEVTRSVLVQQSGLTLRQLHEDYPMVRIGDLISLIFCNQWDEQSFAAWTFRRDGHRVIVTPDAFGRREVPIDIAACEIPNRPYASDAELRDVLRTAPVVTLRGIVVGQ